MHFSGCALDALAQFALGAFGFLSNSLIELLDILTLILFAQIILKPQFSILVGAKQSANAIEHISSTALGSATQHTLKPLAKASAVLLCLAGIILLQLGQQRVVVFKLLASSACSRARVADAVDLIKPLAAYFKLLFKPNCLWVNCLLNILTSVDCGFVSLSHTSVTRSYWCRSVFCGYRRAWLRM